MKPFGPAKSPVPAVGQGTWNMERAPRRAVEALRRGLDLGMTHVDTAEMYGNGRVEEIVGEAIAGRRDGVFLISKVLPTNATYQGTLAACERSLRRLRTDRLDVYLLHWPGTHPLAETIRAFERLAKDGKIRAWGVSNFDVAELEAAHRVAGPGRIACNQVLYHLQERAAEHRVLPWCEAHGVTVVGYSPFGQGDFPAPASAGGRALAAVAARRGATPRQAALAFLTRRPSLFAIPKSSVVAHVEENAGAENLRLSDADVAEISSAFPVGAPRALPTL
jgi:diketogulonate reductase-like aldo/keto reductase